MSGSVVVKDGVFYLSGLIDEQVDFSPIMPVAGVMRIDFADTTQINSVGISRFVRVLQTYGHGKIEYHRCPPHVLDMISTVTSLLGPKKDPTIVKSFFVEFGCPSCQKTEVQLVSSQEVKRSGNYFEVNNRLCKSCGVLLRVSENLEDLLSFMGSR